MNIEAHFESLTAELEALKDRVRNIIDNRHWQTHGEWRESVLRSILRRHLPDTVQVGRGFVADGRRRSTQIDILVYHGSAPLLYRHQDLVIVTPDAVLAIIEVKSTLRYGDVVRAAKTLIGNGQVCTPRKGEPHRIPPLLGLFSYDLALPETQAPHWVLRELEEAARRTDGKTVTQICLGCSHFVHYWPSEPGVWLGSNYHQWHLYDLRRMAAGYFINNVVEYIAGESVLRFPTVWFPESGKEKHLIARASLPRSP